MAINKINDTLLSLLCESLSHVQLPEESQKLPKYSRGSHVDEVQGRGNGLVVPAVRGFTPA